MAIAPVADDEGEWGASRRGSSASCRTSLSGFASRWRAAAGRRTQSISTGPARRRSWRRTSARPRATSLLAFEDTGSYRLLLPAMSEDPRELERFYEETVAPLAAYDEQYETELVATVEAYLESDGNVHPDRRSGCSHIATPCATGSSGCRSCAATTPSPPRGARSWGSASSRCGCWGSRPRTARRPSRARRPARCAGRAED